MARPTNKAELLTAVNTEFEKLWKLIDSLKDKEANFTFAVTEKDKEAHWTRDKNLRDVLIHVYEWQQLLLNWIISNKDSIMVVPFLPEPFTWKSYAGMNIGFFEKHQKTSLTDAEDMLRKSHEEVIKMIESFNDYELFTKAYFKWSGTTSIGAYCISATSSHYDWASKKVKRQSKAEA